MFTTLSWNAPWAGRRRLPRHPSVRRPRLEALEDRCLLSLDSLVVRAAPSGPDKTTNVAAWTDVPDLGGSITTAAGSDLAITVAAEANTTAGKRMFLRALVDGQPTGPSDVDFADGGYTGTHSFTFAKTGLGAGPHAVQVQWLVDQGGTAFIGDRTLTLHASPEASLINLGAAVQHNLDMINQYRAQASAPPLRLDADLNNFAYAASQDLMNTHIPHNYSKTHGNPYWETQGYQDGVPIVGWPNAPDLNATIDQILEQMMAEPLPPPGGFNHHSIIIDPTHTRLGVGLIVDPVNGTLYFTNDFTP